MHREPPNLGFMAKKSTRKTLPKPEPIEAPLILGISGMRGIMGQSLTPEVALRYAAAYGTYLNSRAASCQLVVARDGRAGGEAYYEAAIAGLLAAGCGVRRLGIASTPTVGHAAAEGFNGAIIVTASHNPQEWNGLKLLIAGSAGKGPSQFDFACAPPENIAREIIEQYHRGPIWLPPATLRPSQEDRNPLHNHCLDVSGLLFALLGSLGNSQLIRHGSLGLRCVLDAVNASGSTVGVPFLNNLVDLLTIHCADSGVFPHAPEPTHENLSGKGGLCTVVPGVGADVGFAQDPDADRLAIVDENGRYIGEEYTLVLSALCLLEQHEDPTNAVLVANLSTSRMIDDLAERFGARVERTPVGEAHVAARMIELLARGHDVILGGEGNGGVILPEISFVRDSIVAMGLTLALMARHGKPLSAIVDALPRYAIVKSKQDIPSKDAAQPAIDAVAKHFQGRGRVDLQDGVRVDLDEQKAWLSVRASNTEPIVRFIAEAPTALTAQALIDEARALLGRAS